MGASDHAATQAFYGRWARLYDHVATAPGVRSWRRRAVDALDLSPGDTVVEMGCGTGANLPFLREAVGPGGRVVGVDLTGGMLAEAGRRVDREDWDNVALVQADATDPPVAGGVDGLLGSFVCGMFPDPAAVVDGWVDRLSPGGRIALLDAGPSDRPVAAPLNLAFALFTLASTPGDALARVRGGATPPWRSLAARIDAAAGAVTDRCVERRYETFALGFCSLVSGRRPATAGVR